MWQQRSKSHWMKLGDKNSKYFHTKPSQRFRRNWILESENSMGVMCMGDDYVARLLQNYYQQLFTSSNPCALEEVTQYTSRVVTEDMNKELVGEFTHVEVEIALNQMAPLKAPRPNGMPPIFYQHYWQSIGDDVTGAVLSCLSSRNIFTGLNHTYLTLIPKVKSPVKVSNFRQIGRAHV